MTRRSFFITLPPSLSALSATATGLRGTVLALIALIAAGLAPAAAIARGPDQSGGLPLPRFVSLRSDQVNLRSGPGVRYPVEWVYSRRDLPVEVIAEFDVWRKIRDWQGTEGWVHESMLAGRRMAVVTGGGRHLRADPDDKSPTLAIVEPNVVGRLVACPRMQNYCRIHIGSYEGWLKRDEFWGVYQGEYIE